LKEEIEKIIQSHSQLLISPILESEEENHEIGIKKVRRVIEIRNEISKKNQEIRRLDELKKELEDMINSNRK